VQFPSATSPTSSGCRTGQRSTASETSAPITRATKRPWTVSPLPEPVSQSAGLRAWPTGP